MADVLLVGAGPAGAACATALRDEGFEGSILLVGREPDPPYDRPPASKEYLRGEKGRDDCYLHPASFWEERGIDLRVRTSVMKLDLGRRVARLSTGDEEPFGQALLATGANVRRLRLDGGGFDGIHYLRALGNADAIRADARPGARAVIVGGSFIASEVAASLTGLGVHCTMVMLEDAPLSVPFGAQAGAFFAGVLRSHGVDLVTGDGVERFEGDEGAGDEPGRVRRVVTSSGRTLDADLVVVGAGVVPDVMLARSAGLELGDSGGVACDSTLRTTADGIWAAGDICEYDSVLHGRRLRIEHWEVATAQGRHVARAMTGSTDPYTEIPYFWSDLADWASLEYVGPAAEWDAEIVRGAIDDGAFTILYLSRGRLAAALTVGRSGDLAGAKKLLADRTDLTRRESQLADVDADLATA